MSPNLIRAAGIALYGPDRWKPMLAMAVDQPVRIIDGWLRGEVQSYMLDVRIENLLEARREELAQVMREIDLDRYNRGR